MKDTTLKSLSEVTIWKDIPDWKDFYQINNNGIVKSLERVIAWNGTFKTIKERILKPTINSGGYYFVSLQGNGIKKSLTIHVLIAIAFHNHIPTKGLHVDHDDNDKLNNNEWNIKVITHRENNSKDKKSKYPIGVSKDNSRNTKHFISQIYIDGKNIRLGRYNTPEEASIVYQNKLNEII